MVTDEAALAVLQAENLIPLQYSVISDQYSVTSDQYSVTSDQSPVSSLQSRISYPANPNGSILNIAALCNPAGNVLGLMPHPENHIFPWQHPRASRGERGMLGLRLFENGIKNA
jgi:hypothetical protein